MANSEWNAPTLRAADAAPEPCCLPPTAAAAACSRRRAPTGPPHTLPPAVDQPGMPGLRPGGGSSSNLAGQGVAMVNPAIMAQFAAAGGQPRPPGVGVQGMPTFTPQQMQVYLQHQQALQMAAGRAPSPGSVQVRQRLGGRCPIRGSAAQPVRLARLLRQCTCCRPAAWHAAAQQLLLRSHLAAQLQIYVRSDPSNPASQMVAFPLPPEFVAAKQARECCLPADRCLLVRAAQLAAMCC